MAKIRIKYNVQITDMRMARQKGNAFLPSHMIQLTDSIFFKKKFSNV